MTTLAWIEEDRLPSEDWRPGPRTGRYSVYTDGPVWCAAAGVSLEDAWERAREIDPAATLHESYDPVEYVPPPPPPLVMPTRNPSGKSPGFYHRNGVSKFVSGGMFAIPGCGLHLASDGGRELRPILPLHDYWEN